MPHLLKETTRSLRLIGLPSTKRRDSCLCSEGRTSSYTSGGSVSAFESVGIETFLEVLVATGGSGLG